MILLQLKPHLRIEQPLEGGLCLKSPEVFLHWRNPEPFLEKRLKRLLSGASEEDLSSSIEGGEDLTLWCFALEKLKQKNLLSYRIDAEKGPLFTLFPHAPLPELSPPKETAMISRFAYLRNRDKELIWETPLFAASISVNHPDGLALFHALAQPKSLQELARELPQISRPALENALSLLGAASFLANEEEKDPSLLTWEFHDLLFHARSRSGRTAGKLGGTFRFLGNRPPLPAVRAPEARDEKARIALFRPDMQARLESDPPFSAVLENRRSIREQGKEPLSLEQLGEFLYRSARIKEFKNGGRYEASRRVYPGGGSCYELEIYPLIHSVSGISRGLYLYHPDSHSLSLREEWDGALQELLDETLRSTGKAEPPQVVLLLAARFGRVSWNYESIAYALILKDAGGLLQTFYLVADAMGLAPCAVGVGDSDLFAKAAKTHYYEETTVAEFILGSRS